jgi:cellulose synthase operon protein YhjQ
MTDRKALVEQNETPEDVATLYSWANLHGAKYRDFSASRAQTREKAKLRVQEAIEEERRRAHEEAEAQKAAEAMQAAESARKAEVAAHQAQQAAHAAQIAQAAQAAQAAHAAQTAQAAQAAQQRAAWQPLPQPDRYVAPPVQSFAPPAVSPYYPAPAYPAPQYPAATPQSSYAPSAPAQAYRPAPAPPEFVPVREENYLQRRNLWAPSEPRESREEPSRPAWLAADRTEAGVQPALQTPDDTLQGSRDRLTSRWFALKGVFEGTSGAVEAVPAPGPASAQAASRAPVIAVFSLAGGVGKTSLVATLGRALSARGERVLLVDTAAYGVLPFFFGARDQRPGVLRTFSPPSASGDAPIQMVTIDPDTLGPENAAQETLSSEIARHSRGVSRVLVDLATASGATTRRLLKMSPTVLVPIIPDMSSVVSVSSIDAFFQHNSAAQGKQVLPYYVLNQFDPSLPLHLDVREVLREQVGDRLLPFTLRRAPAVSEALAEGMTVMDYAPNSNVAEDFGSLAGWVKSLAAPASTGFRGVRWSER